ncbi:alpha-hydroxy-acid oxidizing protein [Sphingomonas sp. NFX23]|uniref:alpha-hydroxy-acid oxidizing protein n=1 Tax=Sphingomonas sp. NFX23 TaxID=2819532 RepID=UPI003CF8F0D0
MTGAYDVEDYRQLARRRLPKMVFDYLEGGADDETGLVHNRAAIDRIRMAPRRLVDVGQRDLTTTLFGRTSSMPVAIAPTGLNGIIWPGGDIVLAQAAAKAGIPFLLSTASNCSIEEVARKSDGDRWFQLYVVQRDLARDLTERAKHNGYSTLVLTTDVVVNGNRKRDLRNTFGVPVRYTPRTLLDGILHPRWSLQLVRNGVPELANFVSAKATSVDAQAALLSRKMDATFDWDALAELRDLWPGTLVVKGLARPDDVQRCAALGVDGVVLSNHGGRQLDGAAAPIETLAQTRATTSLPLLIDSGYRSGEHVVKALCSGANMVLLGRATLYGLAARGPAGVDEVLAIIRAEIDRTLALIGCPSVNQLSSDFLYTNHQEALR